MSDNSSAVVKCPQCGESVPWISSQQYRPFCSERCKLLDFGEWANGSNAIADEPVDPSVLGDGDEPKFDL